jgi:hypothetical protein
MNELIAALQTRLGDTVTPALIADVIDEVTAACPTWSLPSPHPAYRVITDQHARIADWVATRTGCDAHTWAGYVCFGLERNGELRVGVVFEGFTGTSANIHVAAVNAHAFTREFFEVVFGYAFNQLKLKRLTGLVAANNDRALKFDRHLGFENETVLKDGCEDGDVIVLVMRPETCRFLRRIEDGR